MSSEFSLAWKQRLIVVAAAALIISTARAQNQKSSSRSASEAKVASATTAVSRATASSNPLKSETAYVIGAGDLLAINVWNEPEVTGKVPVRMDGKITLPLVGEIQASGLTPDLLQLSISKKLNEFVRDPAVTVAFGSGGRISRVRQGQENLCATKDFSRRDREASIQL